MLSHLVDVDHFPMRIPNEYQFNIKMRLTPFYTSHVLQNDMLKGGVQVLLVDGTVVPRSISD